MLSSHVAAGESDGAALQMAFSKKHVEDRKTWLSAFVPGTFLDSEAARITYSDFVHKVLTVSGNCPAAGDCRPLFAVACSPLANLPYLLLCSPGSQQAVA